MCSTTVHPATRIALPNSVGQMLEQLMQAPASIPTLAEAINLHEEDVETTLNELARLGITEIDR